RSPKRRKRVIKAPREGVELRAAVSPRIPDDAQAWLPLVIEGEDRDAVIVDHVLLVPAQSHIDGEACEGLPRVLEVESEIPRLGMERDIRNRREVVGALDHEAVLVVWSAKIAPDRDPSAAGVGVRRSSGPLRVAAAELQPVGDGIEDTIYLELP